MQHKIVLVTGASRGIGAATAIELAQAGYGVIINYRTQQQAAQAVAHTIANNQGQAWLFQADVSIEEQVEKLFSFIDDLPGQLVGIVNNAGRMQPQSKLQDMSSERVNSILQANIMGPFLCCRAAIPRMSTDNGHSGGAIVNVSSMAAPLGAPNEYIDYAMSKGAVDSLTIGLGKEIANQGIRVNGVRPGLIYTDIHADGGEAGRVDRLASSTPMLRGGNAAEVAQAICWLISDQSSYTTASFIAVSGGR